MNIDLDDLNLEFINNDELGIETDLIRFRTNIRYFDEEIEKDKIIGLANINVYNALLYSVYELRMMAQIDGSSFYEYQTLNSVRIFEDWEEKSEFERGLAEYKEESLKQNDLVSFDLEEMNMVKGLTHYNEETENIAGVFVTIEDLNINKEFASKECFVVVLKEIESFFSKLGINYILVMPFPIVETRDDEFTFKKAIKEITEWYQELDFKITKGKLNQNCLVKIVQEPF